MQNKPRSRSEPRRAAGFSHIIVGSTEAMFLAFGGYMTRVECRRGAGRGHQPRQLVADGGGEDV